MWDGGTGGHLGTDGYRLAYDGYDTGQDVPGHRHHRLETRITASCTPSCLEQSASSFSRPRPVNEWELDP